MKRFILGLLLVMVAVGAYAQPWQRRLSTQAVKRLPPSVTNDIVLTATLGAAWSSQAGADSLYWVPGTTYDKMVYHVTAGNTDDSTVIMLYKDSVKVGTYRILPLYSVSGSLAGGSPHYIWGPPFDAVKIFRWHAAETSGYIYGIKTD